MVNNRSLTYRYTGKHNHVSIPMQKISFSLLYVHTHITCTVAYAEIQDRVSGTVRRKFLGGHAHFRSPRSLLAIYVILTHAHTHGWLARLFHYMYSHVVSRASNIQRFSPTPFQTKRGFPGNEETTYIGTHLHVPRRFAAPIHIH